MTAALVLSGCIGALSRDEYEQLVIERGAGYAGQVPVVAVELITAELGVDDVDIVSMHINAETGSASVEVRDPRIRSNVDSYRIWRGRIDGVRPVQVGSSTDLDAESVPASSVAFDRYDELLAVAIAVFGADDARVTSVSYVVLGPGEVRMLVSIDAPRARGSVVFDRTGNLTAVNR